MTELVMTNRKLRYFADHDPLTGLLNRRRLLEELERALFASQRARHRVALFILDLDHFKDINDAHGHKGGDTLLKHMADVVDGEIRRNEILARLGGDEFAILVPEASLPEVEVLAERVVRAVAGAEPALEELAQRQTCSVGVALYPDHAQSIEGLLACADAALYRAKKSGRDSWRIGCEQGSPAKPPDKSHEPQPIAELNEFIDRTTGADPPDASQTLLMPDTKLPDL